MTNDQIVCAIREHRDQRAIRFNHDLSASYRDLKEKEKASGRTYVRFPPRKAIETSLPNAKGK